MIFTFTGTAAAGTSATLGATSGGVTPWFEISGRIAPNSVILSGTGTWTVQLEYSNNPAFDKESDFAIDAVTHSEATIREIPLGLADYVRARCTAFTSGSPKFSMAKALGAGSLPFAITTQSL